MGLETATLVWIGIIISAASAAYSIIAISQLDMPDMPTGDEARGIKANTRSTQESIKIAYGKRRVGGNDVFATTEGNDNDKIYIVTTLSEGECDGIYEDTAVPQLFLDDLIYTDYGGNVEYEFFNGASDQALCTTIQDLDADWNDYMENTCYIVWKLTWDSDYFKGVPTRTIDLQGKKLFDFRDDSTAYSNNPVLVLYDFVTNTRYGFSVSSSKIDTTSWTAAANYCDTQGFEYNNLVSSNINAMDIIDEIVSHFRGTLNWFDGKYYLRFADLYEEASVMSLTDANIAVDESGVPLIRVNQPGRFSRPDGVKVKFPDAENNYASDDIPIGDSTGVINTIEYSGCTDRETACILATSQLERLQLDRIISGTFSDDCIQLEPNDIVSITFTFPAITAQLMRVVDVNVRENHLVDLTLRYESYAIYNDVYDIDVDDTYTCSLPDPKVAPPNITSSSITEEMYVERERTYNRISIEFDEPVNYTWYDGCEVWYTTETDTLSAYTHQFNTTSSFKFGPVDEGTKHYFILRPYNIWGTKRSLASSSKLYKEVTGISETAPDSLASLSLISNDNAVNLYADRLTGDDIELYEFRFGTQWTGGIFLASGRSPNYSIKGPKPGALTLTANSRGTNGLYGDTPRSASTTIHIPKGWSSYDTSTYTDDYQTSGSHDNTEHVTYNTDDYLKCSHTSDVLTGTYTSQVFDLGDGNSDIYLLWLDADVVVTGAGSTWSSALSGSTWERISADTRKWNEIFTIDEAPKVEITIKYKINSGDSWGEANRMELLSTVVEGRYFQVVIKITDPSEEVNALVENYCLKFYN